MLLNDVAVVVDACLKGACRIPGHYDDYLRREVAAGDSQELLSFAPGGFLHTVVAAVVVLGQRSLTEVGQLERL